MEDSVATELRHNPRIEIGDISTAGGRLSFMVRNPTQVDAAVERLRTLTQPVGAHRQPRLGRAGRRFDPNRADSDGERNGPGAQGRDGRRPRRRPPPNRPGGTKEITVVTEGGNRILVEVPGVENPDALKKLIGQTARLEFKLVDLNANPADVQQGRAPPGSQVLPMAEGGGYMAVTRRVMVSGDQLTDAHQGYDQDGRPTSTSSSTRPVHGVSGG